jgi:hypothetical protein
MGLGEGMGVGTGVPMVRPSNSPLFSSVRFSVPAVTLIWPLRPGFVVASISPKVILPGAYKVTFPPLSRPLADVFIVSVEMLPWVLVNVTFPPVPPPLADAFIVPVLISPTADKFTGPAKRSLPRTEVLMSPTVMLPGDDSPPGDVKFVCLI